MRARSSAIPRSIPPLLLLDHFRGEGCNGAVNGLELEKIAPALLDSERHKGYFLPWADDELGELLSNT